MKYLLYCLMLLYFYSPLIAQDDKKELPLTPERTISITTDEGSWISLDVSPDGSQIVFEFLGDLYSLPITGGNASRITSGLPFETQPHFSPDGEYLIYVSDRDGGDNLWIYNFETQEEQQLTDGKNYRYQDPEWTPDGEYIVASRANVRGNVHKPWLFHKDGGSGAELVKEPTNLKLIEAAFGPDLRYIWFSKRTRDWQYNAVFPQYQVAVYDRETGEMEELTDRYGSGFSPALSPDGKWLVYGSRHDEYTGLVLRNLDNGDEVWLAYPVQRDDQESRATRGVLPGMSFTPDSRNLIASYGGKIWSIPIDGGEASGIPFKIDEGIELGPQLKFDYPITDDEEFVVKQIRDAVISPDGSKLAFVALDKLYLMDFPEGIPQRITTSTDVEAQPTWAPDGNSLAYVSWNNDGGDIYKISLIARRRITVKINDKKAIYKNPVWSKDGLRIVTEKGYNRVHQDAFGSLASKANEEIVWFPAAGGSATTIARANGHNNPHFGPEPDRIYLHHAEKGLSSVRWDGTDEKFHVKVEGEKVPGSKDPINASLVKISSNGKNAVAQVYNEIYWVTIPVVGGETPKISVAKPDKSSFPVRKLTDIGGQFPAWGTDNDIIHWSIGKTFYSYLLSEARSIEDSLATVESDSTVAEDEKIFYQPESIVIEIKSKVDIPTGKLLLKGARIITSKEEEIIETGDIYIENNRIRAVGPSGQLDVPDNVEIIDVTGKTIIPGLVDTHGHLRPTRDIHKRQVWTYMANLAYGVTTTRDPQTQTTDVLTYEDLIRSGEILGPRIYSTGPGVFYNERIRNLEHARKVLKRYSEHYDTKTIKMYVAGNREQRQWIIMAAREQQLMPTTEGSLNMKLNLTQLLDGYPGHEHAFPIYPLYDDVIRLTAESKMVYTPTLLVSYGGPWAENYYYATENVHNDEKLRYFTPHRDIDTKARRRGNGGSGWFMDEEHVFPNHAVFVKDLVEAGGLAGIGSHGQLQGLGYHWELWSMQSGGLSPHDALKIATIHGAQAIGLANDLGSIEVGKLADLVILNKNPLDDIRNTNTIEFVMKNGRLYNAYNLEEIFPEKRTPIDIWWQTGEPGEDLPGVNK